MAEHKSARANVGDAIVAIGSLMVGGGFLGAAVLIGKQAYTWLRFGYWPEQTLRAVLKADAPISHWVGVQKAIDAVLSMNGGFAIAVIGAVLGGIFISWGEGLKSRRG